MMNMEDQCNESIKKYNVDCKWSQVKILIEDFHLMMQNNDGKSFALSTLGSLNEDKLPNLKGFSIWICKWEDRVYY